MLSDTSKSMPRITVFTPTYNRAYILHNLYNSLNKQTFREFEWLIVDDGSSDNTAELVREWIDEIDTFFIRYYRQENGGKHRAVNYGVQLAQGEIFFVVDSDDYLTEDALAKINQWFKEIEHDTSIVSVAANKGWSATETDNEFFCETYLDKTFLDMDTYQENGKYVLRGERAIAFYTEILRKYPYPEFSGEKFLTEAIVYNRIAHDGYKTRFYNDIIWLYKYLEDGLSAEGTEIYLKNPYGYALWFCERADFLHYSPIQRLKMYYSLYCDLKDIYSEKFIAKCLNVSIGTIIICHIFFTLKHIKNDAVSIRSKLFRQR